MKWFKHDTDCFLSEGLNSLLDDEGFAGYGRWFRLLEIIAFKMDKTDKCSVEYSTKKWCSLLRLKQKKLISFLKQTENKLKTKVVYSENIIKIEIPNLLNKRDNFTKNLQVTNKKLASIDIEVEVDKDKDKEIYKEKSSRTQISDTDFILSLKNNLAYKNIDIDKELAKMDAWFLTPKGRGRKKTHRFILNWINKCEREVKTENIKQKPLNAAGHELKIL